MTKKTPDPNYSTLLKDLQELSDSKSITAFVPSLNKEITLKPLNVKQQKSIIRSAIDPALTNITFTNAVNDIIVENSPADIEFYAVDRPSLLIALRVQALGRVLNITQKDVSYEVDLQPHVDTFNTHTFDTDLLTGVVDSSGIRATLLAPTITIDTRINKSASKTTSKSIKTSADALYSIGDLFVYELVKYITTLEFNGNVIDFTGINIKQGIDAVESLPMALSGKIVAFIEKLKTYEDNFTKIAHIDKKLDIGLDATFFTS